MKPAIKLNQVWKQRGHEMSVIISGKAGGKWKAKVLTDKPNVFKGTHKLSHYTLWAKYDLIK